MFKMKYFACAVLALPLLATATDYQIVERPRQECWNEQVPVQSAGQDYGGAIIGGIAGGIIGNQVGGGNGRTIATAVGAMTGAVAGDRLSARGPSTSYQTVQRCRTVMEQVRVPVAYPQVQYVQEPVQIIEQRVYYVEPAPMPPGHWKHRHHHHHDD